MSALQSTATSEQIRALTAKYDFVQSKYKREAYEMFYRISQLNPEENRRERVYFRCVHAWKMSPCWSYRRLTVEQFESFLPDDIKTPWRQ